PVRTRRGLRKISAARNSRRRFLPGGGRRYPLSTDGRRNVSVRLFGLRGREFARQHPGGKIASGSLPRGLHGGGETVSSAFARRCRVRRKGFSTARHHSANGAGLEFSSRNYRRADSAGRGWTRE